MRKCIQYVEDKSDGTKVVELQNALSDLEIPLQKLKLRPPPMQSDFQAYWTSFTHWILDLSASLRQDTCKVI